MRRYIQPWSGSARRKFRAAVGSVVQTLESRTLLSASTLPFVLNFNASAGGVVDAAGQGTGFTGVQANRLGTQLQPNLIHLLPASGELDITTTGNSTAGSNYGTDNTGVNALQTQFDATTSGFTITTRLKGPLSQLSAAYEQGGVFFGPDQDNYIKFVALDDSTQGQILQFTDEQKASTHTLTANQSIGSFAAINTLDLRLTGDAATGIVTASYSINGAAYVAMSGSVALTGAERTAFFNATGDGGIITSAKNNLAPVTVAFTHFEIDAGSKVKPVPSVSHTDPAPGATNVNRDDFISADLLLPNDALSAATVTSANVMLFNTLTHAMIPATVNTSGGGDTIVLQPQALLAANTEYTFTIGAGVKDRSGASFTPYTMTFTTGTGGGNVDPSIAFDKVALPTTTGNVFTCLKIGPDGMLYASEQDGRIFRYTIEPDGTLSAPQIITSLQTAEGGQRLVTGFCFDPAATAADPIIWVSNGFYGQTDAPNWSGKITKMSGPNLATVQDMVVNLPRSILNHMTNTPTFGPDGALYIPQGSNTAYGAPDSTWGNRPEDLLSAAILRLDVTKLTPGAPLDVKTPDGGGTYNPFAAGAPLTLYATGVRNSFQILWDENGVLWAPTNGSASGGDGPGFPNAANGTRIDTGMPYSGPAVAPVNAIPQTEDDWLYSIVQGGYYGHPDPARGEYVIDGGNPTAGNDPEEISDYPVGTQPDPNYRGGTQSNTSVRGSVYDLGAHHSPDGIIEYHGSAFGGALDGKLLIAEYSGGDDILVVTRGANGTVADTERGFTGMTDFTNPLSLVEDTNSGDIYVAEYGGAQITLLKPHVAAQVGGVLSVDKSLLVFNDVTTASSGGTGPSPSQTITLTNTGTGAMNFAAGALKVVDDTTVAGDDSTAFSIVNAASLPSTLLPGQSFAIQVNFTATKVAIQAAILQIQSTNAGGAVLTVSLHGIGTTGLGGTNEPSLPRILRAFDIPTITGDGPNDSNQNQTVYPAKPDPSSQEVVMPRLVKAGAGPVTITPLASFNVTGQPAARFGYYTPGTPSESTELFTFSQGDSQTTSPTALGSTVFDPGSADFGLYAQFPHFIDNGEERIAYSEDALNTWDTSVPRKFRFFPLENPDGSIVPNAYVFAAEDYNLQYDSNDIVAIIRNVKPAPGAVGGAVLGLQNPNNFPYPDRLTFNRVQNQDPTYGDIVHDTNSLVVENTGDQPLLISSLTLSDPTNWTVSPSQPLNTPIAPGATMTITIKFTATKVPAHSTNETNDTTNADHISVTQAGGVYDDTLTIASNDPNLRTKAIQLEGYWQHSSGSEEEPGLQTLVNLMAGYDTVISTTQRPNYPNASPSTPTYYGEEVNSPYWVAADPSQSVTAFQVAAFHNQNTSTTLYWYPTTTGTPVKNKLYTTVADEGQSLLPHVLGSTTKLATASFSTSSVFGWDLDGNFSDDALNKTPGHQVRFFPLRDRDGNIVTNTWIMVCDYHASDGYQNFDFQDNVYIVTNMRPAKAPATPTDLQAVGSGSGVLLEWAPVVYAAGVGYDIYRSASASGAYTLLNASPIAATSFVDAGVASGATAYYKVVAVGGDGAVSVPATAFATSLGGVAVTAPTVAPTLGGTPASTSIALSWTAVPGATSYRIQRMGAENLFHDVASGITATSYTDSGLTASTAYIYQVRGENAAGAGPYGAPATFSTTAVQSVKLTSVNINTTTVGSTTPVGTNGYNVVAGGADIYTTADSFRFDYEQITGDFDISVQITSLNGATSVDAKAGLMARMSLNSNSAMAFMGATAADLYRFTTRAGTGAADVNVKSAEQPAFPNVWVRLQRVGNILTGYRSTDGVTWTKTGSITLALNATLYVGLATSGHSATGTTTAAYANFQG
ncbi:MAG TPA: Ig-like domain-containing protein [Tepidisphaeraceae bacterium]|nr:Ig-like domain-containing protein [Tepidisphaeraceae bacterium]